MKKASAQTDALLYLCMCFVHSILGLVKQYTRVNHWNHYCYYWFSVSWDKKERSVPKRDKNDYYSTTFRVDVRNNQAASQDDVLTVSVILFVLKALFLSLQGINDHLSQKSVSWQIWS